PAARARVAMACGRRGSAQREGAPERGGAGADVRVVMAGLSARLAAELRSRRCEVERTASPAETMRSMSKCPAPRLLVVSERLPIEESRRRCSRFTGGADPPPGAYTGWQGMNAEP